MGKVRCLSCKTVLSATNPHSKCDKCLLSDNGVLCAPNSPCVECSSLSVDGWKAFLTARKKAARDERYRSSKRSRSSSPNHDRSSSLDSATDPPAAMRHVVERSPIRSPLQDPPLSRDASPAPRSQASPSPHDHDGAESNTESLRRSENVLSDLGEEEAHEFREDPSSSSPMRQSSKPKKHKKHKKRKKSVKHSSRKGSDLASVVRVAKSSHSSSSSTVSGATYTTSSHDVSSLDSTVASSSSSLLHSTVVSSSASSVRDATLIHRTVASTVVTPARTSLVSSSRVDQASSSAFSAPPSPSQWSGFRDYLEREGLVITPAVGRSSSSTPAVFGEEDDGPTPAKLARRAMVVSPAKRKVPSSLQSTPRPASTRLGPPFSVASPGPSTPLRAQASSASSIPVSPSSAHPPSSPSTDRREVSFNDQVQAIPATDADSEEHPNPGGIESLSDIYHPRVRLSLIGNVLGLSPPELASSGFTSSLVDDITVPKLVLPHGQLMASLVDALDKSMSEAPAFKASSSMAKPNLPEAPMTPLPFHERAHVYDTNLHLLGKEPDLKRYSIHDESLAQVDSTVRKSLRHLSLLEQTVRAINAMAEGTEPLDHVSIRSLGETLLFSLSAVTDASAWVLGSICYMRRHGMLTRRDAAWSDSDCTRLLRSPWSSKALFGDQLSPIADERAKDQSNVWTMRGIGGHRSPPRAYAQPKFRVNKKWEKFMNPTRGGAFRSPGKKGAFKQFPPRSPRGGRSPKANRGGRGGRGGGKL